MPTTPPSLGDVLEIDDRTVLVLGQELDVAHDQPDVANALVHRAGETLFLVDTGVTTAFRGALRAAVDRVGPWTRLVVLTTHGHPDHVGNNDLADELGRERNVPVEHYAPARDLPQMLDPAAYLDGLLDQAVALQELALSETKDKSSVDPHEFAAQYARGVTALGVGGANPNPLFTGMMAVNQLAEIGLRPEGAKSGASWSRPALVNPAPVAGMPRGIALVPAAVAMLRWKLQKKDR